MGKKNKGGANLGRLLIKDRFGRRQAKKVDNDTMLHTTEVQDGYDWGRLNLASVTEESSFHEFLRTAELAGTEFTAEKLNITFVNPKQGVGLLTPTEQLAIEKKHDEHKQMLKIPRRPKWNTDMTAEDLQRAESESFLEWRRGLAQLQEDEDILMTPYEKNLEFWRQLWRVVERSDVIVQIVDARNPLMFRSEDLEAYVKEVNPNKMNMILVNKSDLLTQQQREHWARYFDEQGIRTAFFSATLAEEELKENDEEQEPEDNAKAANELKEKATPEQEISLQELKAAAQEIDKSLNKLEEQLSSIEQKIQPPTAEGTQKLNSAKLLSRLELIEFFKHVYDGPTYTAGVTTMGLVGYPNVGKSSTINALMTQKKVSVSATPGKTKHFQTLYLEKDLLLCDCPGLVMPSFVLTKADMILNGILPIDQMRDHVPAVNLLCTRIPRHILEDKYGFIIAKPMEGEDPNRPPYSEELLLAFGYNRGFMTANGQPDQARAARYVCKDYVNGKLLFCLAPPTVPQEEFHVFPAKQRKEIVEENLPARQQRAMRIPTQKTSKDVDQQFFDAKNGKAYVKGRSDFPHIRVAVDGLEPIGEEGATTTAVAAALANAKPWRGVKKEKREKLRRKFSHLDQH